jgi:NADH:ubiquinone oxidoreductase subunit F (NADH-binding)
MTTTLQPAAAPAPRRAVGVRLMAGPPQSAGPERIEDHERRLGPRPAGGASLIDVLAHSGLRGRGGAWFPTSRKWAAVARSSQQNAVVVVNASEGEPLSSKDKALMSQRPHLVLDGAVLAAEAVGASEIVLYLSRGSRAAEHAVALALKERNRSSRPGPPIRLVRTAHRYIAGESSAAMNRASDGPSKPRFSLQRAAEKGVDGRPTLVQNAETLAHVAMIARYGSDWFRRLGTQQSPGSTLMTLCGNVRHPGVYEVDLGATLGSLLTDAGGTVTPPAGALLGGYFGTWLRPEALAGLPLDVDRLRTHHGAALGCGVVAVLPQGACGIAEATRILTYLAAETSGQCGPCVNGLAALSETMERITISQADPSDLARVRRWIEMVRGRGACHHPDGAIGQLASALSAFGDDLQRHVGGRRCAGTEVAGFPAPPAPGDRWR